MKALRLKDVAEKVGLGESTLYRMIAVGKFPKPFEIVPKRNAWLEDDIDAWLLERAGREPRPAISMESDRSAACERLRLYLDRVEQLVDARVRVAATKSAAEEWIARARSEVEALDPIWTRLDSFSSARS